MEQALSMMSSTWKSLSAFLHPRRERATLTNDLEAASRRAEDFERRLRDERAQKEVLREQREKVSRELEEAKKETDVFRESFEQTKSQLDELQSKRLREQKESADLVAKCKKAVDEVTRLRSELKSSREKLGQTESMLKKEQENAQAQSTRLQTELTNTQSQLGRYGKELEYERNKVRALQTGLDQSQRLSETRARELRDVQAMLATNNEPSDSDVLQSFNHLNETIYQCSALLVGEWTLTREKTPSRLEPYERTVSVVGEPIAEILLSDCEDTEVAAQIVLQNIFTTWSEWILSRWTHQNGGHEIFSELYTMIRADENQITGGRWRSLSLRYLQRTTQEENAETDMYGELLDIISDILVLMGATEASEVVRDRVEATRGSDVRYILRLAWELRGMMGQSIVSCDFSPLIVAYGEPWDHENMEGAYNDEKQKQQSGQMKETVFCTTGLGVSKSERIDETERKTTTPLKAKVVLLAQVNELIKTDENN